MKAKLEVEFEYESLSEFVAITRAVQSRAEEDRIEITRMTITCYDSDDKPFMTETPIGSTPQ